MKEDLKDQEYREAFVSEHIDTGIPFQIRALREQRNLTQKKFEKLSGMKQAAISRLENPDYSGFTLSTLKKIASIYDIGLMVRFVPISDLVEWELNLDSESLKAVSYEDDPYFKETEESTTSEFEQHASIHESSISSNAINLFEIPSQTTESTIEENELAMAVGY